MKNMVGKEGKKNDKRERVHDFEGNYIWKGKVGKDGNGESRHEITIEGTKIFRRNLEFRRKSIKRK